MTKFSSSQHLPALDGVRGWAILSVMIFHLTVLAPVTAFEHTFYNVISVGWVGVELFFVLSGFLITGILLDAREQPNYFRNFYARRVLRIFPLFYAIAIFSFVILPYLPLPPAKAARFGTVGDDQWMYWTFLSNFAIASWGSFRHGIMDVTWSVAIEEQFYIFWPAIVLLLRRRSLAILCLAIVALSPLLRITALAAELNPVAIYTLTPLRMDGLAAGALLAILVRSDRFASWVTMRNAGLLSAVGAGVFGLAVALAGTTDPFAPYIPAMGFSGLAVLFAGAILAALCAAPNSAVGVLFVNPLVRVFGKYSYCLYLIHLPIRAAFRDLVLTPASFAAYPGGVVVGQLVFYVVSGSAALTIAWLSYHLFEKQFLKLKRYFPSASPPPQDVATHPAVVAKAA